MINSADAPPLTGGADAPHGDAGAPRDVEATPGRAAAANLDYGDGATHMPEPYRFGADRAQARIARRNAEREAAAGEREERRGRMLSGFRPSTLLVVTLLTGIGAALAVWAWTASGRDLPAQLAGFIPRTFADVTPQTIGLLFVAALVLFGAVATIALTLGAMRRAFDPSLSAPYRTYVAFTLVAAMLSGYTSMYGVVIEFLDPSQGFIRYRIFPVLVFFFCFLFVYLTWSWTFDLVIRSEPKRRWKIAVMIPLLAMIPIFAVSTTTSALGLAGPRILERRLLTWLDDYSDSLASLTSYINETESAALSLDTFATRIDQLADQEAQSGAITGYAGRGSVAAQLRVAADDLEAGAGLLRSEKTERVFIIETMAEEIEATRADILDGGYFRDAGGAPLPVRDWQDKVQAQERSLSRQWEEVASRAYVSAALGQLELLDTLILRGGVSGDSAVAQAQREGQAQVSEYLASGRGVARRELEAAAAAQAPQPPDIGYESPLLVLFGNWRQAILPWSIAIALDFGPWVWIALAGIAGYDRRRSRARYAMPEGHHWRDEIEEPAPRVRVIETTPAFAERARS